MKPGFRNWALGWLLLKSLIWWEDGLRVILAIGLVGVQAGIWVGLGDGL